MSDRYALELLLRDIFNKCFSAEELTEMYSDCMRMVAHASEERSKEILIFQNELLKKIEDR